MYIGYKIITDRIHAAFQKAVRPIGSHMATLMEFSAELGKEGLDFIFQFKCPSPKKFFERYLKEYVILGKAGISYIKLAVIPPPQNKQLGVVRREIIDTNLIDKELIATATTLKPALESTPQQMIVQDGLLTEQVKTRGMIDPQLSRLMVQAYSEVFKEKENGAMTSQWDEQVKYLTFDQFCYKNYGFNSLSYFIDSFDNYRTWNKNRNSKYMTYEGPELAIGGQLEYKLPQGQRKVVRDNRPPMAEQMVKGEIGRELYNDIYLAYNRALEPNANEAMLSRFAEQLKKINKEFSWREYGCLSFTNFVESHLKEFTTARRGLDVYISLKEPNLLPIEEIVVDSDLKTESVLCGNAAPFIPMNR
jgi:hypothetical protein